MKLSSWLMLCLIAFFAVIFIFPGPSSKEGSVVTEVITYSIPESKQSEAAQLYKEVYESAMKAGNPQWARSDAEAAVQRIYGVKEISRKTILPEKSRK